MSHNTLKYINKLYENYNKEVDEKKRKEYLKELMDSFEGYIFKFYNFLIYGHYKEKDSDIKSLVNMISNSNHSKAVNLIQKILSGYSEDDILSRLQLIFLKCVRKYEQQENGPGFTGFLYNYYKYEVRDWIRDLSKDPLNKVSTLRESDFEEDKNGVFSDIISIKSVNYSEQSQKMSKYSNICFVENFNLTNLEKYILYLRCIKGFSDKEISELLNVTRPYINIIKNKSIRKLEDTNYSIEDINLTK